MASLTINMPDAFLDELKRRAESEGLTVDELILRETGLASVGPPSKEFWDRLKNLPRIDIGMSSADLIREIRDERDRELDERFSSR